MYFWGFQSYLSPIQTCPPSRAMPQLSNFNPTLVQFKLTNFHKTFLQKWYFNPTLVQFKRWSSSRSPKNSTPFQSYLSPIQTSQRGKWSYKFHHFNPTLVQFKLTWCCWWIYPCYVFQSYLSPIQTVSRSGCRRGCDHNFNPTLVQFKPRPIRYHLPTSIYFNPTLVQFKPTVARPPSIQNR